MANRYNLDTQRLTFQAALTANTVTSLRSLITSFCQDSTNASLLFVENTAANAGARRALYTPSTGVLGTLVYQSSDSTFWEITDVAALNIADDKGWTSVTTAQANNIQSFLAYIFKSVGKDSSIGNAGANATYVMNGFLNGIAPSSTAMTTYGVPLAPGTERTCSGDLKHYYIYSLSGTTVRFDIIFGGA